MPNLETRLARLEQGLHDATALRTVFVALRRLSTSGQINSDDIVAVNTMAAHRSLDQMLKGLKDEELHEGIQLVQTYIELTQGMLPFDPTLSVSEHT